MMAKLNEVKHQEKRRHNSIIHIVGVTQPTDLMGGGLQAVQQASAIIGSERQLDIVKPHLMTKARISLHALPKLTELNFLIDELTSSRENSQPQRIVVLASGDPLYYGIGRWFSNNFDNDGLVFHPAISSIQMACHRLALSLQDVTVISVHGRPLATLRTKLKNKASLVILTDKNSNPHALAQECLETGFEQSTIIVLENLSYPHERIRTFSVGQLLAGVELDFDPLHVSVIKVKAIANIETRVKQGEKKQSEGKKPDFVLPEFPGIPDASYITGAEAGKGMITKREVRLCILSLLQPANQDTIWDIGAGCGGVAVELSFWNDSTQVYAVECHKERLEHLHANQQRFGVVKNLHIISGTAPECLPELPRPNKVFIGGSGGNMAELLASIWPLLPDGGLMVVSAVVSNTKQALFDFSKQLPANEMAEVEVVEVSVKRGQLIDGALDYTPKLPVEVFKFTKRGKV